VLHQKRAKLNRIKRDLFVIVMPLFKELTEEEKIQGNPHTLQKPKETIEQNLPGYQDQDFNKARNIFTKCRACLKARGQSFETLPMKSCKLIYRINKDYELQAEEGFLCKEVIEAASVLRPEINIRCVHGRFSSHSTHKFWVTVSSLLILFFSYIFSCLLKILITVAGIFISLRLSFST